jgi:hypothetical protein
MIQELENRAMIMELENPNLINMDYDIFQNIKIPKEIELTDGSNMVLINNKAYFTTPIAFKKNDVNSISEYLKTEIKKGHKVWIRRIITHGVGNEYTILESLSVNKLIL